MENNEKHINTAGQTRRRSIQKPSLSPIYQPMPNFPWDNPVFNDIYQKSGHIEIGSHPYNNLTEKDLQRIQSIGFGANGNVTKCKIGNHFVAVKDLKLSETKEMKQALMELNVIKQCSICPYVIDYYGYICTGNTLYICMEYMASCLDKLQEQAPGGYFPENVVGKITISVIRALDYLREKKIIHRDVKPSNMLVDRLGNVKLCDFAISGQLVDSMAQSCTPGCILYLAPERIALNRATYDIRSDVWSLGISLFKMATGHNPYTEATDGVEPNAFMVLKRVKEEPAPILTARENISEELCSFVNSCLRKNWEERPKYIKLMEHDFFVKSMGYEQEASEWLYSLINRIQANES